MSSRFKYLHACLGMAFVSICLCMFFFFFRIEHSDASDSNERWETYNVPVCSAHKTETPFDFHRHPWPEHISFFFIFILFYFRHQSINILSIFFFFLSFFLCSLTHLILIILSPFSQNNKNRHVFPRSQYCLGYPNIQFLYYMKKKMVSPMRRWRW